MNKKEVLFLKKAYKKEKDAKIKERILMILYNFQGDTLRDAAEKLNCDHKLVLFWKKRYLFEGLEGLKTRQKSGKPRRISQRQEANLKKIIGNSPQKAWTTKRVHGLIFEKTKMSYSQRQVTRILNRWNLGLSSGRPMYWQRASEEGNKIFREKKYIIIKRDI